MPKKTSYFSKEMETLSPEALKNLQFEKTRQTLERAYHKSDFYRRRFDEGKIKPQDFKSVEDIARLPFIDKHDLIKDQEENPPLSQCLQIGGHHRFRASGGGRAG